MPRTSSRVASAVALPAAGTGSRRSTRPVVRGSLAARSSSGTDQLAEIQRSRLLLGAVSAIEEFGYGSVTVAQITSRARVSRRTFYELFENREECLMALVERAVDLVEQELAAAGLAGLPWRERVRGGLSTILSFFDREPTLARVCVVEALHGGSQVLARREQVLARLAGILDEGREQSAQGSQCTELTAEALVGAAFGVVHARVLRGRGESLSELLGELMGIIVLPYLGSAAARHERRRGALAAASLPAVGGREWERGERDPLREVPMRLTYRTTCVLECIAAQPGVSNREAAERAGVSDQGQISKLLARLERIGLIANAGEGHARGERNAWNLTPLGAEVARRLAPSLTLDTSRSKAA